MAAGPFPSAAAGTELLEIRCRASVASGEELKMGQWALLAILGHPEVVDREIGDWLSVLILDVHDDVDHGELDLVLEGQTTDGLVFGRALRRVGGCCDRGDDRDHGQGGESHDAKHKSLLGVGRKIGMASVAQPGGWTLARRPG